MCLILLYNMNTYLKKCTSSHKETSAREKEIPWLTYFANLLLLYREYAFNSPCMWR